MNAWYRRLKHLYYNKIMDKKVDIMGEEFIFGFTTAFFVAIVLFTSAKRKWMREKATLLEKHDRFLHIAENSKDFIYYCDIYPKMEFRYISPSAEHYIGKGTIERSMSDARMPFERIHPDDYDVLVKKVSGELDYSKSIIQRWKDNAGNYRWFEEYATPIYENGQIVAIQGILRNIDEKIELQNDLNYRLYHDYLTDLYNREYFEMALTRLDEKEDTSVAIILCDLDELKYTNDHYGHKKGDGLLQATAELLNRFSNDAVTVARIGGDEFVFLMESQTEEEVKQLVHTITEEIHTNNRNPNNLQIHLSIGSSFSLHSKGNMTKLFTEADQQMYEHKNERKQSRKHFTE